ncbi:MAG: hypothetical protein HONBIEJF_01037 [Fimbriimonadaceae bacterium]|nr:hypothetical protein [Fimbriimonadaceae bacterium]
MTPDVVSGSHDHPEPTSGAPERGEVLVALVNNLRDWQVLNDELWYRIPIHTAPRRWPPQWMAFYQTKVFGEHAYAIHRFGRVAEIRTRTRAELFPGEPPSAKSHRTYHQIILESLETLPHPIVSRAWRRIVFVPTTLYKLEVAAEINDLFDDSPLEDALWQEMKRIRLPAERQFFVAHDDDLYALDFAVFCQKGRLAIEADGDSWHADPVRIPEDNRRNNALASLGWHVLRFNGMEVRERMASYCVPQIVETVNRLGGVLDDLLPDRSYSVAGGQVYEQLRLFEASPGYAASGEQ